MIFWLPYLKFTIDSNLSKREIISRLVDSVSEPRRNGQLWETRAKKFEGNLSESGFTIKRIIRYRNSFLPMINGKFQAQKNGTRILITIQLHPLVLVFMLWWMSPLIGMSLLLLLSLVASIITKGAIEIGILGIFLGLIGMLTFGYFLTLTGFSVEANKARQILDELLVEERG